MATMSPLSKKSTSRVKLPPTNDVHLALIGKRQYQATEYRTQKQVAGSVWRGGNTVANSLQHTPGGPADPARKRPQGRLVAEAEYNKQFGTLPPVERANAIPPSHQQVSKPPATADAVARKRAVENSGAPARKINTAAAGLPLKRSQHTPLPISRHPPAPRQKRERVYDAPDPHDTSANSVRSRPAFFLTRYLEKSLQSGHGQVFDASWSNRFDAPVAREKGWAPGYFGSSKLDRKPSPAPKADIAMD
eukprot:TRINITY_DN22208_c0_g1_i1.p1 TRINITY_DN22208_c0_g1~~TRINITY_DN22208_c0_g1_i1.p1  ORF type:complete len:248 (+),score=60.02 TRINITY_DN22208_c0_g1_i1:81-824(+)